MKDSNLRLSTPRTPTYHLSNEKTVTHFHRQITNAYQTLIVLAILAGTSLSYPGFVFRTGFEPVKGQRVNHFTNGTFKMSDGLVYHLFPFKLLTNPRCRKPILFFYIINIRTFFLLSNQLANFFNLMLLLLRLTAFYCLLTLCNAY